MKHVVLLAAVLLAVGCQNYPYETNKVESKSWSAAGIDAIEVQVNYGAIAVAGSADTIVTADFTKYCKGKSDSDAKAHLDDIVTADSISGRTLFVHADVPTPNQRGYSANTAIAAPARTGLHLNAANGAITINNYRGNLSVQAPNGRISADMAAVDSGTIINLNSSNGVVELAVPADASLAFDASTANGRVEVPGFSNVTYTRDETKHKIGVIGSGHATATLVASNGRVTIRVR